MTEANGPYLTEISTEVATELAARLSGEAHLTDADELAVNTAIAKASYRAFLRGVATYATQVSRVLAEAPPDVLACNVRVEPNLTGSDGTLAPEPDPWAERYGEAGREGGVAEQQ